MCSKNNSDTTYCSEVEELLKSEYKKCNLKKVSAIYGASSKVDTGAIDVPNKFCKEIKLRRSQRLSQKLMRSQMLCGQNVDTISSGKVTKITNIKYSNYVPIDSSIQDVCKETQLVCEKSLDQPCLSLNKNKCRASQIKYIPEATGAPLDLSKKSKVSKGGTQRGELSAANATIKLNSEITPYVPKSYNKENANTSQLQQHFVHRNKSKRQTQSCKTATTVKVYRSSAKELVNPIQDVKYFKNNLSANKYSCEKSKKSTESLKKKLLSASDNRKNLPNSSTKIGSFPEICNFTFMHSKKSTQTKNRCGNKTFKHKLDETYDDVGVNCSENILSDKGNSCKRVKNSFQKNSLFISDKRIKLSNQSKTLGKTSKRGLVQCCPRKVSGKGVPASAAISFCNEMPVHAKPKNEAPNEHICSENKKSNKNNINSNLVSGNRKKLTNGHIKKLITNTEKLRKATNSNNSKNSAENYEKRIILSSLDIKTKTETEIKNIPPCTKNQAVRGSQKRKNESVENILKTNSDSYALQHIHQNIKSEPLGTKTSSAMKPIKNVNETSDCSGKLLSETNFTREIVKNKSQNNFSQLKNETSDLGLTLYPKSSSQLNSNILLRSATKIMTESSGSLENKKIKMEIFSQKSTEGKAQTKTNSQTQYSAKAIKIPSSQHNTKEEFNKNEAKNLTANTATNFKSTECATLKRSNDRSQLKTEKFESEKPTLNKNYIKSFDRNQFLNEIQKAKNHINMMAAYKNNTFEVPPTPAETPQDISKKSIVSDVYTSYVKQQVPSNPLHLQSHSTHIITPDDTISSELFDSASSSPSLPESLCELFNTKDIKNILNVERTSYRLHNYHIRALALVLNLRLEYLVKALEKIINIHPHVLKDIDKAVKMPFVPDNDIFSSSSAELWPGSDIVLNSQSPKER